MNDRYLAVILATVIFGTSGCRNLARRASVDPVRPKVALYTAAQAAAPQRLIAETHKLDVIAPEAEVEKSWESLVAFCGAIQCEVVSSSITARAEDSSPSGNISLRVAPEDAGKLFAQVQKLGKVAQHTIQREDKTTAVIDTDAKIKNLTAFRDNLRNMLAKPSATVKDLVEIQQQLVETQSQLDAETAQRKVLANETEKILVEFSFRVQSAGANASGWSRIRRAFSESGAILADSTAAVIMTIVAIIPWLIFILPGFWLARKIWRKSRRNRAKVPPAAPATVLT
jgi:hypothetical protein